MQKPELLPNVLKTDLNQPVMLGLESLAGGTVQTLGLAAVAV